MKKFYATMSKVSLAMHEDILYHHRIRIVPRMPGWFCGIYSIKALRKLVEEGNFLNL